VCIWLYAGKPGVSRTTRDVRLDAYSDKVSSAENQQERLIEFRGWVIGFVDGEGCFSIGFVRQPSRAGRSGYKTGYQVTHEFVVTQGERSLSCLHELHEFFGVGQVLINNRYDNDREHLHRYRRAPPGRSAGNGDSVLPAASAPQLEVSRLREVRTMRRPRSRRLTQDAGRSHRDR
jgi:LAGLIDADG endonuclease